MANAIGPHQPTSPGGTESNNQLPKTEAFPSEKPDFGKTAQKGLLFIAFNSS